MNYKEALEYITSLNKYGSVLGLDNMKSRVDDLGGFFSVSYDEKGFRIFITIKKQSE